MNNLREVPLGYRMVIQHIHDPEELADWDYHSMLEDGRLRRELPRYVTVATLYDPDNVSVCSASAICSHRDNPSRKKGRLIAHNRCMKTFDDIMSEGD